MQTLELISCDFLRCGDVRSLWARRHCQFQAEKCEASKADMDQCTAILVEICCKGIITCSSCILLDKCHICTLPNANMSPLKIGRYIPKLEPGSSPQKPTSLKIFGETTGKTSGLRPPQPNLLRTLGVTRYPEGLQRRPVPCWAACATRPCGELAR